MSDPYTEIVARRKAEGRPQTLPDLRATLAELVPAPEPAILATKLDDFWECRAPAAIWRSVCARLDGADAEVVGRLTTANWDIDGTGLVAATPRLFAAIKRAAQKAAVPVLDAHWAIRP